MIIVCAFCSETAEKRPGSVNHSHRIGAPVYCNKACAGLARRKHKTAEQKRAEKAAYDAEYRSNDTNDLKARRRAFHLRTYDRELARVERKKKMARHIEYCRRPEYRKKKSVYDAILRAKKNFGHFWESALLLSDIQTEVLSRATRYEIDLANGKLNKTTHRRRDYERTHCNRS